MHHTFSITHANPPLGPHPFVNLSNSIWYCHNCEKGPVLAKYLKYFKFHDCTGQWGMLVHPQRAYRIWILSTGRNEWR